MARCAHIGAGESRGRFACKIAAQRKDSNRNDDRDRWSDKPDQPFVPHVFMDDQLFEITSCRSRCLRGNSPTTYAEVLLQQSGEPFSKLRSQSQSCFGDSHATIRTRAGNASAVGNRTLRYDARVDSRRSDSHARRSRIRCLRRWIDCSAPRSSPINIFPITINIVSVAPHVLSNRRRSI